MSKEVLIGRQPVFNRDYNVEAYELLYRGDWSATNLQMTAGGIIASVLDIGLDRIAGALPIYLNVDADFLLSDEDITDVLHPDSVCFEVLETVEPTPEVLNACKKLKAKGYKLLLDDVTHIDAARPFLGLVDIFKIDFAGAEGLEGIVKTLRQGSVKLLAEKVETYEDFEKAKALNFDLFQGYFFRKPDMVKGSTAQESRVGLLRAMQKVLSAQAVNEVFPVVKQDVTLSYRLLRYINSAAFGLRRKVESIEQALSLLGLNNIRRWLTLLTMTMMADDKPKELIRVALVRARMLEQLATHFREEDVSDDFMLGLFSVLDALLDQPMEKAIAELNLADHIRQGLLDSASPMGQKLALVLALEQGDWNTVARLTDQGQRVDMRDLSRWQAEAFSWGDEMMAGLL